MNPLVTKSRALMKVLWQMRTNAPYQNFFPIFCKAILSQKGATCNGNKRAKMALYRSTGSVSLHWLIHEIPSYHTLQYLGIDLKHMTPNKG